MWVLKEALIGGLSRAQRLRRYNKQVITHRLVKRQSSIEHGAATQAARNSSINAKNRPKLVSSHCPRFQSLYPKKVTLFHNHAPYRQCNSTALRLAWRYAGLDCWISQLLNIAICEARRGNGFRIMDSIKNWPCILCCCMGGVRGIVQIDELLEKLCGVQELAR